MQNFRKNPAFGSIFWVASAVFASLVFFDLYHYGNRVPVFWILAALGFAVAALWGRGNLALADNEALRLNLGLFHKPRIPLGDVRRVEVVPGKYIKIFMKKSGARPVRISLALLHDGDRDRFVDYARGLAPE